MEAIEFGLRYCSCKEGLEWRKDLPPGTQQAEAYRVCNRGDWLLWQLERCKGYDDFKHVLDPVVEGAIVRAIEHMYSIKHEIRSRKVTVWRKWARGWISGSNRMDDNVIVLDSIEYNVKDAIRYFHKRQYDYAGRHLASYYEEYGILEKEMQLLADQVHDVIPTWPEED
jgi:hypothetical protein